MVLPGSLLDESPKTVCFYLFMVKNVRRKARDLEHGLIRFATFDDFVAAKDFGIGFFEYLYPDFIFSCVAREQPTVFFRPRIEWKIVVDHNVCRLPIDV